MLPAMNFNNYNGVNSNVTSTTLLFRNHILNYSGRNVVESIKGVMPPVTSLVDNKFNPNQHTYFQGLETEITFKDINGLTFKNAMKFNIINNCINGRVEILFLHNLHKIYCSFENGIAQGPATEYDSINNKLLEFNYKNGIISGQAVAYGSERSIINLYFRDQKISGDVHKICDSGEYVQVYQNDYLVTVFKMAL